MFTWAVIWRVFIWFCNKFGSGWLLLWCVYTALIRYHFFQTQSCWCCQKYELQLPGHQRPFSKEKLSVQKCEHFLFSTYFSLNQYFLHTNLHREYKNQNMNILWKLIVIKERQQHPFTPSPVSKQKCKSIQETTKCCLPACIWYVKEKHKVRPWESHACCPLWSP